jgi:outer membrane receptor protein involved in Fe transport
LATLELRGEPAGASIELLGPQGDDDTVLLGALPAVLHLPTGSLRLRVSAPGWQAQQLELQLEPDSQTSLILTLSRETGSVVVQSSEPNALILLDGKRMGFTPSVLEKVVVGKHRIELIAPSFRPFVLDFELQAGREFAVDAELQYQDEVSAASRASDSIATAPASVSMLSQRELELYGFVDLADAMRGVRGFYQSNDHTYSSLGVRGFSLFGEYGNRLQIQVDGHILNEDWIGQSFVQSDLLQGLMGLERIEVVRGPGSALYGTGAFFGVINLVTPTRVPQHSARGSVSSYGSGGIRMMAEAATTLFEDGGFWISGGGTQTQNDPSLAAGSVSSSGVLAKAWTGPWSLSGYFNQRRRNLLTGTFSTIPDGTEILDTRSFAELRFEPMLNDELQLLSRAYFDLSMYEGAYVYAGEQPGEPNDVSDEDYLGLSSGAELRALWRPIDSLRLTLGGEYQAHFHNASTGSIGAERFLDEEHPYHVFSAYSVGDWQLARAVGLTLGARFDGWLISDLPRLSDGTVEDRFLYSVNPRLAMIFQPYEGSVIKLLGGRAFRAPSIYELTYSDDGMTQIVSPQLDAESIISAELEYIQKLPAEFSFASSLFFNHISNLIRQVGSATPEDPLRLINAELPFMTLGVELELSRSFRHGWQLAVNYAYHRARIDDPFSDENNLAEGLAKGRIANSPEHLAALRVLAPLVSRSLYLSNRVSFESGRLDRGGESTEWLVLWDATLSAELEQLGMTFSLGARNLLDWRYALPVGEDIESMRLAQAGRSVFAELRLKY